jgi:hypothetical protein
MTCPYCLVPMLFTGDSPRNGVLIRWYRCPVCRARRERVVGEEEE